MEWWIIIEDTYLDRQRNGKGKEYKNNSSLIFEGEYLNEQRNIKGNEYDNNNKFRPIIR